MTGPSNHPHGAVLRCAHRQARCAAFSSGRTQAGWSLPPAEWTGVEPSARLAVEHTDLAGSREDWRRMRPLVDALLRRAGAAHGPATPVTNRASPAGTSALDGHFRPSQAWERRAEHPTQTDRGRASAPPQGGAGRTQVRRRSMPDPSKTKLAYTHRAVLRCAHKLAVFPSGLARCRRASRPPRLGCEDLPLAGSREDLLGMRSFMDALLCRAGSAGLPAKPVTDQESHAATHSELHRHSYPRDAWVGTVRRPAKTNRHPSPRSPHGPGCPSRQPQGDAR